MPSSPKTLSAQEAAARLGVKRRTLYTYASRGWLRSLPGPTRRERRYLATDVEHLRLRGSAHRGSHASAAAALGWGPPVLDTAISHIDADGPNYRGIPALTLAERNVPFERVADLVWGSAHAAWPAWAPPALPDPQEEGVFRRLRRVVAGCMVPPELSPTGQGRWLVRLLAMGLADRPERRKGAAEAASVADAVLIALGGQGSPELVNAALVLCADHELNSSTLTARVAASTGAQLDAVVLAALCTLSGPRHGANSDLLEARLAAWTATSDPVCAAVEEARTGPLPGFGHRLYPEGDPRGAHLLTRASEAAQPARLLERVGSELRTRGHPAPNLDVGLVAVRCAAGLPRGAAAGLFAVGRAAGWVAHALEQRQAGVMLRPRARYVGAWPEPDTLR
jgi:citrate synthase